MSVRSLKSIDRQAFAHTTSRDFRRYEDGLDPIILTGCLDAVPAWATLSENVTGFLGLFDSLLDTTEAEVTAMQVEVDAVEHGALPARASQHNSGELEEVMLPYDIAEPGCREAPRYYGGHHDVRVHSEPRLVRPGGGALASAENNGPSSTLTSPAPPSLLGTVLDPDTVHGDTLAALDVSESQLAEAAGSHRALYRWTGGTDILDDPQLVHRGLLEQRVHQLAGSGVLPSGGSQPSRHGGSGASTGAVRTVAMDSSLCAAGGDNTSGGIELCDQSELDSDVEDEVSSLTAAPRLPDRRPELTLGEALRVMATRTPGLVTPRGSSARWPAGPPEALYPTEPSFAAVSADLPHTPWPDRLLYELQQYPGALYLKSRLSTCPAVCEALSLDRLLFSPSKLPVAVKASPLGLQGPSSYAAWLFVGEAGGGTRSHANVGGAHGWHVLLRGTKKWRIAHPLDRHLVSSSSTGALVDLLRDDTLSRDALQHAGIFEVTQHAGEALFLPSEAVYCDVCLEDTVALHINLYDATTAWQEKRFRRLYTMLLAPTNRDAMFPTLVPLTMVDLILFADNVYPSFRGKNRTYRPDTQQDVIVVRGFAEFTQVGLPCSELGARVELEAMQHCFSIVGKVMLEGYQPGRYAVGVPKGYVACEKEHRLLLFYYVKPFSLQQIKEALAHPDLRKALEGGRRPLQWFTREQVTLPDIEYFRSTCSHQGLVPNYVPLNVLLAQSWPFEKDLCRYLVSLPRIILDKAYNQRGFIRPGSVWHYSRFDLDHPADTCGCQDQVEADADPDRHTTPKSAQLQVETSFTTPSRLLKPASHGSAAARPLAGKEGKDSHNNNGRKSRGRRDQPGRMGTQDGENVADIPSSFAHSFVNVEAVENQPGSGWCRTFLFYCSSLLDTPVAMHPIAASAALQNSQSLLSNGINSKFHPRILEFVWNVNMLEEYGLVNLLQLETAHETAESVIRRKILHVPCFSQFQDFVELHGMHRIQGDRACNVEKVMAAVLWFACTPCIVGFVSGTSTGETRDSTTDPSSAADLSGGEGGDEACASGGPSTAATSRATGPGYASFLDTDSEEPRGKWDTVCLTATAASALLQCVPASPYAKLVSRLSNWLCDEYEERGDARQEQVLDLVRASVHSHDVEQQAVVFEVLRIKKQTYNCQCGRTASGQVLGADSPPSDSPPASDPVDCRQVNGHKLALLETMIAHLRAPQSSFPCLTPSL